MKVREYENNNLDKDNKKYSSFITAQILASIIIVCSAYALKTKNPALYTRVKDWYNYNINYKNFDTSDFKSKVINITNNISDSVSQHVLHVVESINKE